MLSTTPEKQKANCHLLDQHIMDEKEFLKKMRDCRKHGKVVITLIYTYSKF